MRIGAPDDNRKPAPLPSHVRTFLVAGTVETQNASNKALKIIGDYLVSVKSALGEHPDPRLQLKVPEQHKAVFFGLNHFEIQFHTEVAQRIVEWFYPERYLPQALSLEAVTAELAPEQLKDIVET